MNTLNNILQEFCIPKVLIFFEAYHIIVGKTLICNVSQIDNKLCGVTKLSDNKRCSEIRVHIDDTYVSTTILYDSVYESKIDDVYDDIIGDVINLAYDDTKYTLVVSSEDPDYVDITVTRPNGNSCTWCV